MTESPHGEAKELAFFKAETADPDETNGDEINLDINTK